MKSTIEDISPVKKKFRIEVTPEDIKKERDRAVAEIAKKVHIPGFRPGKAPKAIVERRYGEELRSDVMSRLITDAYLKAVHEHGVRPVHDPEITDVSGITLASGESLTFTATVEVRPKIELKDYDRIEIKEPEITVSDAEVEQTINRLREMYANLEVVEGRAAENGDVVIIDFEGFHGGKAVPEARASDYMITIGAGNIIAGFDAQLIGLNKGDKKEIIVKLPDDHEDKNMAGKEMMFIVTVKEIKRAAIPDLDDDFAKDVGGYETVDELKTRVRQDIEARKKSEAASAIREELLIRLIDSHVFDVPEAMVNAELQYMLRQQLTRMAREGKDYSSFDHKKFMEERRELAEKRVKGILILDAIAEKEGVTVNDSEVVTALSSFARTTQQSVDNIRKYYESQDEGLVGLKASLARDKTLNLLLSRIVKSYN